MQVSQMEGRAAIEGVLVELVLVDLGAAELQKGTVESGVEKLLAFGLCVEFVSEIA